MGTPALTFGGVLFAQWVGRRADTELETRSRREEVMRNSRGTTVDPEIARIANAEVSERPSLPSESARQTR